MNRVFHIYIRDIKKIFVSKFIIMGFVFGIISLVIAKIINLEAQLLVEAYYILNMLLKFVLVYFGIEIFAKDYLRDSSKLLFSVQEKRWKIYIEKIMANITCGMYIGVLFLVLQVGINLALGREIEPWSIIKQLGMISLLTVTLASFSSMLIILTKKYIIIFIINYLLFFESVSQMIASAGRHISSVFLGKLFENNLFWEINQLFALNNFEFKHIKHLLIATLIFSLTGIIMLNRKDIG